jgi:hypothetical protein
MKVELELNGVKTNRDIPLSWNEVTFKQFLELEPMGKDLVKLLAFFMGIEEDVLRRAKITGLDTVLKSLAFLQEKMELSIPKQILGHVIPKDLGFETIGQYADIRDSLKAEMTPIQRLEKYPLYCAIYACRPYDWQKAEAMAPEFFNAPAPEVLAIGHFTLLKLIGSSLPTKPSSPSLRIRIKKFKQDLRIWVRNTAIMARLYIWKKKQAIAGKI